MIEHSLNINDPDFVRNPYPVLAELRQHTPIFYEPQWKQMFFLRYDDIAFLLKDKRPDPDFPPSGEHRHIDQGAHERMGSFETGSTVGLFRHEDESFSPYFIEHVTVYPGRYRVRTSLWSFQWDKGEVLPSRGTGSWLPYASRPGTETASVRCAPLPV